MNRLRLALLGISILGASAIAYAQEPAFNIIEPRQAGQDLLAGNFVGIRQGVEHKAPVKPFARTCRGNGALDEAVPQHLPARQR